MRLLVLIFVVMLAVLSVSADARELYAMPLLLPLAALAAPAAFLLPTRVDSAWFRASAIFFGLLATAAWLMWIALELGLIRLPPYAPGLRWLPLAVAAAYTAAWIVLMRRLRGGGNGRGAIAWTAGVTLGWALAMTLYIAWLDSAKSYRAVLTELAAALPPSYRCISSRGLGEPQRALLDYYARIKTYREESAGRRADCELLIVQQSANEAVPADGAVIWRGERGGDVKERLLLLRRR